MYFLVNASPPKPFIAVTSNFAGAYVTQCREYWATSHVTLTPQDQGQILYFLVDASPPKPLDVVTQILQVHMSYDIEGTGQRLVWSRSKSNNVFSCECVS